MVWSTVSGSSRFLSLVIVKPATENARSDGTSVAGIAKNFLARIANFGNLTKSTKHVMKVMKLLMEFTIFFSPVLISFPPNEWLCD